MYGQPAMRSMHNCMRHAVRAAGLYDLQLVGGRVGPAASGRNDGMAQFFDPLHSGAVMLCLWEGSVPEIITVALYVWLCGLATTVELNQCMSK